MARVTVLTCPVCGAEGRDVADETAPPTGDWTGTIAAAADATGA